MPASVAVVILNFNGRKWLEQFLAGVISHSISAQVIIADNASTDDSIAWLNIHYPTITVIPLSTNKGFCGGYNDALKKVSADYFVLLNSDVEVTPGWLEPVIRLMESDLTIAAAQPKILSYHQREYFEYAGAAGGYVDLLGYPFCRGRIFDTVEKDEGQYDDTRRVFWATGACLFVRAKAFAAMGGFDESFFAHMEEIDLCWRLQRSGYHVYYCSQSIVYHVGGGTLSASNPTKTFLNFRNGLSLLVKNLPFLSLTWKLPLRILLDWLAAIKFLADGSWPHCSAVLRAHVKFVSTLGSDWRKRDGRHSLPLPFYHRLLTIDYFILGRKTYKQLNQ